MRPGGGAEGQPQVALSAAPPPGRRRRRSRRPRRPAVVAPAPRRVASVALSRLSPRSSRMSHGLVGDDAGSAIDSSIIACRSPGRGSRGFPRLPCPGTDAPAGLLGALAIALGKLALRAVLQPADGGDHEPHFLWRMFLSENRSLRIKSGTCAVRNMRALLACRRAPRPPTSFRDRRRRAPPAGKHGR